jgi:hypothetical protein
MGSPSSERPCWVEKANASTSGPLLPSATISTGKREGTVRQGGAWGYVQSLCIGVFCSYHLLTPGASSDQLPTQREEGRTEQRWMKKLRCTEMYLQQLFLALKGNENPPCGKLNKHLACLNLQHLCSCHFMWQRGLWKYNQGMQGAFRS